MKNLLKLFMLAILFGSFSASAQTLLLSSSTPNVWRNFNLPNPVPGPPNNNTPYANYGGQPANWQTGPTNGPGWAANVVAATGTSMWVNEAQGQVYGALFRANFNLTTTNGVFYMDVLPDNQCEIFINGTQVGGLFNWSNGMVTVCIPNNVLQVGNNIVAIQVTEWRNNATRMWFDLFRDNANVTISPGDSKYCTDDAPVAYTGTPAGGTWAGNGMAANGIFTPSTSNIGQNTLTYTVGFSVGTQPAVCPVSASVIALVEECCPDDMASFTQVKHTFVNTSTPSGLPSDDSCCTFGFKSVTWTVCEYFQSGNFGWVQCYQVNTYNLQYTPSPNASAYQICLEVVDCAGCEDRVCGDWTWLKKVIDGKSKEIDNVDDGFRLDKNEINVFPNPNTGTFQIRIDDFKADQNTEMYITDLSGKRVLSIENPSRSVSIENAALPAGIYVFVYKTDQQMETERILIQR